MLFLIQSDVLLHDSNQQKITHNLKCSGLGITCMFPIRSANRMRPDIANIEYITSLGYVLVCITQSTNGIKIRFHVNVILKEIIRSSKGEN